MIFERREFYWSSRERKAATRRVFSRWSLLLTIVLTAVVLLTGASSAWAQHRYAIVFRDPAYGVKSSISTPAVMPTQPGLRANFVGIYDQTDPEPDLFRWMQTGWVMGDGVIEAPDGQVWPVVPCSYKETISGTSHIYGLTIYTTTPQPLNYARAYRVERYGTTQTYMVYIQDTARPPALSGYPIPAVSEAAAEILDANTHTRAGFNQVKYRGNSTWFSFDQDSDEADNPPFANFPVVPPPPSNYQFTAWNGM
jgi:hypothetical protein